MRSLFNKDKFIGRPIREEENNINYPNNQAKEQRKYNYSTPVSNCQNKLIHNPSAIMDELNMMAEQIRSSHTNNFNNRVKKTLTFID